MAHQVIQLRIADLLARKTDEIDETILALESGTRDGNRVDQTGDWHGSCHEDAYVGEKRGFF